MINQMVLDRVGLVGVSQVLSLSWIGVGVLGWVLVLLDGCWCCWIGVGGVGGDDKYLVNELSDRLAFRLKID